MVHSHIDLISREVLKGIAYCTLPLISNLIGEKCWNFPLTHLTALKLRGQFFQHCWSIFLPRYFYAKNNIDVLIFYVSTSNIHRGANEWLPMHLLLACIPGGPINWKGWILAFWLYCFLGCRVFLDVSAWNLLRLHQCFEPIPFSFSFVVVTSIVVDVVDIVVVVAYAVISQQTRIFFPLCLCCRTSFQLLNKVAITLGGSKSCIYFSLRM